MKENHSEIPLILLTAGLMGVLIFWLPIERKDADMSDIIVNSPIIHIVRYIYMFRLTYLINIPVAFANIIYAVRVMISIHKEKMSVSNRIVGYLTYLIYIFIASVIFAIHLCTFVYVIGLTAG